MDTRMMSAWALPARRVWPACGLVLAALGTGWAHAQEDVTAEPEVAASSAKAAKKDEPRAFNYVVGALVASSPDYAGGDGRTYRLRPAWAIEWGRFRLSTSRGNSMMGHGLERRDSGASATLAEGERFNLSASLRIDKGRDDNDSPRLAGLPEVRSTLRGKLSAGYALTDRWALNTGLSQDLLGRDGGAQVSAGVGYTWPATPSTKITWGASTSWGDGTYMRSHFGVPVGSSSGLVPFMPKAGIYSVDTGVDFMTALNRHWVVLGGVHFSQLQGDARTSPVTVKPSGYSASVGLAYRCCR